MRLGRLPLGLGHGDHLLQVLHLQFGRLGPLLHSRDLVLGARDLGLVGVLLLQHVALGDGALELRLGDVALALGHFQPRAGLGFRGAGARDRVVGAARLDARVVDRLHLLLVQPRQSGIIQLRGRLLRRASEQCAGS